MGDRQGFLKQGNSIKYVPDWLYEEEGAFGLTKASFLWWSNLICCIFHVALGITTLAVAGANGDLSTPRLTVYLTDLSWVANTSDALVPTNVKGEPLSLSTMTFSFFMLSALAHGSVCLLNFRQAFAANNKNDREVTRTRGWYLLWIHQCRNPIRWLEYAFSASLMIITISVASGVAHLYSLISLFILMLTTMCFGHFCEALSRPLDNGNAKPTKWKINNESPELLTFPELPAAFERLYPHLLGYVPYTAIWVIILHSFFYNVSGDGGGPPAFVYAIVIGEMVIFTSFGIAQFAVQYSENGPEWFYWNEWSYQIQSLVSKGFLGLILIWQVFAYDNFQEAAANA